MLLYGVAIATGPFQCEGMWSAAGSWGVIGDVGMGMWLRMCVKGGVVSCVKGKKERVKRKKMASMHPEHLDENTCIEMTKLTHSLWKHKEQRSGALICTRKKINYADDGIRECELLRVESITNLTSTASYWPVTSAQIYRSQIFLQHSRIKKKHVAFLIDWCSLLWRADWMFRINRVTVISIDYFNTISPCVL